MTEKMELVLAEALTKALDVAEKTGDFVVEQSPEVVQQLLMWKMIISMIGFFAVVLSIFALVVWLSKAMIFLKKMDDAEIIPLCIFGAVIHGALTLLIGKGFGAFTWLKILIAPKLYLLEYAAALVK
jgi:hypothetical protein